jgi:hypothetical protein
MQGSHTNQLSSSSSVIFQHSSSSDPHLASTNHYPAPPLAHQSQPLTHKAHESQHHTPPAAHHQPRHLHQPRLPVAVSGSSMSMTTDHILQERLQQQQQRVSIPTAVIIESRGVEMARRTTLTNNRLSASGTGNLAADHVRDRPMALAVRSAPLLNPPVLAKRSQASRTGEISGGGCGASVNGQKMLLGSRPLLAGAPAATAAASSAVQAVQSRGMVITDLGPTAAVSRQQQPVAYQEDLNAFCEGKQNIKIIIFSSFLYFYRIRILTKTFL